ncbi:MAG: S-layer homology domain-containing protein, partial [Oscillospiraceae bacterium]|nr:S-layer homology domain-containing protein [Oscillospiraceae bacterium]
MKRLTRRILSAALCAVLLASAFSANAQAAGGYKDVPKGHWAAAYIETATAEGLFQGRSDGKFGLGEKMSRAAFVTVLMRMFGWEEVTLERGSFDDNQDKNAWYYGAVETAYKNGAVTRLEKKFRPTDPITREEMAVMLVRALGYGTLAGQAQELGCPFKDVKTNAGYITLAYQLGITGGYTATAFGPDDYASREQTAAMLVRTLQKMKGGMGIAGVQSEGGADSAVHVLLVPATLDMQRDGSYAFSETAVPEENATSLYWAQVKSAEILADPAAAAAAIAEKAASYAGAAVSFEGMSEEYTESYTALVAALRQALADKMLYAFTQAPAWGESSLYDYAALAPLCNRIVVQVAAHEDTEGAIPMCPANPLEEVYHAVMMLKEAGGADKMMLYITTDADVWYSYTSDAWKGERISAAEIKDLLSRGAQSYYSTRYAGAYLTVPNGSGHR